MIKKSKNGCVTLLLALVINASYSQTIDSFVDCFISLPSLNTKDFAFLKAELKDTQIIFLGESNHGDGETIRAKTQLIKYLYEELNFEVLILERNLYEMHSMNQFLEEDKVNKNLILNEMFSFGDYYSLSYKDMNSFIIREFPKKKLQLYGLDIVYNTRFKDEILNELIQNGCDRRLSKEYLALLKQIVWIQQCYDCEPAFNLGDFIKLSDRISLTLSKNKSPDIDILKRTIKNNIDLASWIVGRVKMKENSNDSSFLKFISGRDKIMADNLDWIMSKLPPNKRIIVSTSTYHITPGLSSSPTMADFLSEDVKKKSYFLPFIYNIGKYGQENDIRSFTVDSVRRPSSSLEHLLSKLSKPYGILSFACQDENEKAFVNTLNMYPSILLPNSAKWTSTYSGVFFISEMKPDLLDSFTIGDYEYYNRVLFKEKK